MFFKCRVVDTLVADHGEAVAALGAVSLELDHTGALVKLVEGILVVVVGWAYKGRLLSLVESVLGKAYIA